MCVACHISGEFAHLVPRSRRIEAHGDGDWRCVRDGVCVDCHQKVPLMYDRILGPSHAIGRREPAYDHMCIGVLERQIVGPKQWGGAKKYLEVQR
jgi:hypothetical protein